MFAPHGFAQLPQADYVSAILGQPANYCIVRLPFRPIKKKAMIKYVPLFFITVLINACSSTTNESKQEEIADVPENPVETGMTSEDESTVSNNLSELPKLDLSEIRRCAEKGLLHSIQ